MRRILLLLLPLAALLPSALAQNTGTGPVSKYTSGATKNDLTEDLNVGSGRTVTAKAGSTVNLQAGNVTLPSTLAAVGVSNGAKLDALGNVTWATDKAPYYTGNASVSTYSLTAFARSVLASANAAGWRSVTGSAPATSGTSLLYGDGAGGTSNATIGAGITFGSGTLSANVVTVANRTGNVTLSQSDVSGLKTTDSPSFAGVTAPDFTFGTGGTSALGNILGRAPRQGLVFDGTAGPLIANLPAFGTGSFSVVIVGQRSGSAQQHMLGGANNAFIFGVRSGNALFSGAQGGSANVDSTATITTGVNFCAVYTRTGTTGQYYLNGKASNTITDANNYSTPTTDVGSTGLRTASFWNGTIFTVLIYNRALSAAEVGALAGNQTPAAADYNTNPTGAVMNTVAWVNNSNANFDYDSFTGATAGGFTATINAGSNSGNSAYAYLTGPPTFSVKAGDSFLVQWDSTITAGTTPIINGFDGGPYLSLVNGTGNGGIITATAASSTWHWQIVCPSTVTSTFTLANMKITPLGLLFAGDLQQPGNGLMWIDKSGNGAHEVLPASGVRWSLPSCSPFTIRGRTSTNGNQQMLGAACLPANCQITRIRARAETGTPTITIGTASGGAQLVSSVTLSSTWQNLTIVLTGGIVGSASSVWVGSNSTDLVDIDMRAEPLNF